MVLLFKYFVRKNFAFSYSFITQIFHQQTFGVYLSFNQSNNLRRKMSCLPMVLLLKHFVQRIPMVLLMKYFVNNNLACAYGFIIQIFCQQKLRVYYMALLLKYFVDKNLIMNYGFIIETFCQQKFGLYIWFCY